MACSLTGGDVSGTIGAGVDELPHAARDIAAHTSSAVDGFIMIQAYSFGHKKGRDPKVSPFVAIY
jgi:hypothetical protein